MFKKILKLFGGLLIVMAMAGWTVHDNRWNPLRNIRADILTLSQQLNEVTQKANRIRLRDAVMALQVKDFEKANRIALEVLESEQGNSTAWAVKGSASFGQGRYDDALHALNMVVTLRPDYGLGYYNRAIIQLRRGEAKQAMADLQRSCELNYEPACKRLKGEPREQ